MTAHGGLVACRVRGRWRGALILGPSGSGKSDLILRALDQGLRLVADDRVQLWRSDGGLWGQAPEVLSGLMEIRGLGIAPQAVLRYCEVSLVVRCEPDEIQIERLGDAETATVEDSALPLLRLHARHASSPAKLRRALAALTTADTRVKAAAAAVSADQQSPVS